MMKPKFKKDRLRLVTHPRSGTHWVLKTILDNFATPYKKYMDMFGGHRFDTEIRDKFRRAHILHCSRNIQHVLMSVFRMRERNGIKLNNFSDFIRTPYRKMPRITGDCKIYFDDKIVSQPRRSWIQDQLATPPELWLLTNTFWLSYADWTITYEQMQQDQEVILDSIQQRLGWKRKPPSLIAQTIGWHPPNNKPFDVSVEDQEFLADFGRLFETYKERSDRDIL